MKNIIALFLLYISGCSFVSGEVETVCINSVSSDPIKVKVTDNLLIEMKQKLQYDFSQELEKVDEIFGNTEIRIRLKKVEIKPSIFSDIELLSIEAYGMEGNLILSAQTENFVETEDSLEVMFNLLEVPVDKLREGPFVVFFSVFSKVVLPSSLEVEVCFQTEAEADIL